VLALAAAVLASTAATAAPATHGAMAAAASARPNNKPKPPPQPSGESESSSAEPAAPPPDPIAAPAGTTASVATAAAKEEAKTNRNASAMVMAGACAMAVYLSALPEEDQIAIFLITGFYFPALCSVAIEMTLAYNKLVHDPPDPNFAQVALTQPTVPPSGATRCPKGLTPRGCARIRVGLANYTNAVAATSAAVSGLVTSVERFAGAVGAGSVDGQLLQAGAAKAYAAMASSAIAAQQLAGRALASILRAAKRDVRLSARARNIVVARLSAARGLPASIVSKLSPADQATLGPALAESLAGIPRTLSLAAAVSTPTPTTALTNLHKSVTVYEVAALVRGLTTQGVVSAAAGETLLNDLRQSVTATTPDAHTGALAQFGKDVAAQVTGPGGTLLATAGQGLS
jgi:hypothetical protein